MKTALQLDWLEQFLTIDDQLPSPNWELIYRYVEENQGDQDQHQLWINIARNWVDMLGQKLTHDYTKTETENFILLSNDDHRYNKSLSMFLERCRNRLLSTAQGICADDGFGKHVVCAFIKSAL